MSQAVNWQGIATLIGSIGGFLTVLVTLFIQIMNWKDQRRIREEQSAHKDLLCSIKDDTHEIRKVDTAS